MKNDRMINKRLPNIEICYTRLKSQGNGMEMQVQGGKMSHGIKCILENSPLV